MRAASGFRRAGMRCFSDTTRTSSETRHAQALRGLCRSGVARHRDPSGADAGAAVAGEAHDFAKSDVPGANLEMIYANVEIAPGFKAGRYCHAGVVMAQVVEGEFWLHVDGQPEKILQRGRSADAPDSAIQRGRDDKTEQTHRHLCARKGPAAGVAGEVETFRAMMLRGRSARCQPVSAGRHRSPLAQRHRGRRSCHEDERSGCMDRHGSLCARPEPARHAGLARGAEGARDRARRLAGGLRSRSPASAFRSVPCAPRRTGLRRGKESRHRAALRRLPVRPDSGIGRRTWCKRRSMSCSPSARA